jgi:hypothetical protein
MNIQNQGSYRAKQQISITPLLVHILLINKKNLFQHLLDIKQKIRQLI